MPTADLQAKPRLEFCFDLARIDTRMLRAVLHNPVALSMSFIVFQPIAVQLMQQSLDMNFTQAVNALGINTVLLTYARSAVAIFLGAILAMTNVELETQTAMTHLQPKRQFIRIDQLFRKDEPVKDSSEPVEPVLAIPEAAPTVSEDTALPEPSVATEQLETPEQPAEISAQPEPPTYDTPEKRAQKVSEIDFTDLSALQRVVKVLELFPDLSDRELGKLSSMAPATAKKHKEVLQREKLAEGVD